MSWFRKNKPPQEDTPAAAGDVPGTSDNGPVPDDTPAPEAMSSGGPRYRRFSVKHIGRRPNAGNREYQTGRRQRGLFKRLRSGLAKTRKC